jgi:hypothetical protein
VTHAQADELSADFDPMTVLDAIPTATGDQPTPFLAGTFALYKAPDGSVMGVFDIAPESLVGEPGIHRQRIPAGILRAASTMLRGGGPLARLAALTGRRRAR